MAGSGLYAATPRRSRGTATFPNAGPPSCENRGLRFPSPDAPVRMVLKPLEKVADRLRGEDKNFECKRCRFF